MLEILFYKKGYKWRERIRLPFPGLVFREFEIGAFLTFFFHLSTKEDLAGLFDVFLVDTGIASIDVLNKEKRELSFYLSDCDCVEGKCQIALIKKMIEHLKNIQLSLNFKKYKAKRKIPEKITLPKKNIDPDLEIIPLPGLERYEYDPQDIASPKDIVQHYLTNNIYSMVFLEIYKAFELNLPIKKCELCHFPFIVWGRKSLKHCALCQTKHPRSALYKKRKGKDERFKKKDAKYKQFLRGKLPLNKYNSWLTSNGFLAYKPRKRKWG